MKHGCTVFEECRKILVSNLTDSFIDSPTVTTNCLDLGPIWNTIRGTMTVFCPGFQKGRVPSEKGTLAR